ncbi:MAG: ABC transporter permease [bacterium]
MKSLMPIIKKELKRFFTDKRLLATLILPGLLIFVMYSVMGGLMESMYTLDENVEYTVYAQNHSEELGLLFDLSEIKLNIIDIDETTDIDAVKQGITDGDVHLLIYFPENFDDVFKDGYVKPDDYPQVEIFYNQDVTQSYMLFVTYQTVLNELESLSTNLFDINTGEGYNLSIKKEQTNPMAMMIPMLLMMFLTTGVVATATESISGEKERGTIASLLITPVSRFKLAGAKIIAITIPSIVSAVSSFLGLYLSLPSLTGMMGEDSNIDMGGFAEISGLFLIVLITVLMFTVLIAIVSTYAKSVKESQQLTAPIMLLASMAGMVTMFFTIPETYLFFIPLLNSALMITSVFDGTFSLLHMLITCGINILIIIVGIFVIGKMFNSEKIIFNK